MTWFTEFVSCMWGSLATDAKASPATSSKNAYSKALGPHHPFFLRQIAKIAMLAAPSRKNFDQFIFPNMTAEESLSLLQVGSPCLDKLKDTLWGFFKANNITELE